MATAILTNHNKLDYGSLKITLTDKDAFGIPALAILTNGNVASESSKEIKIWNQNTGTLLRTLTGQTLALTTLSNGDLLSASVDNTIKIWNPNDGTLKRILTGHANGVWAFTTLSNGDLVSGSYQEIKIWNPNDGTLKGH